MAPPTNPATGSPQRVPGIVGREPEQAALRNAHQNLLNGDGGLVLIDGEAGIGKTTLMRWLAREAEAAGARVLWGHAYDNSITPPYGLWTGLAQGLTDAQAAEQLVLSTRTVSSHLASIYNKLGISSRAAETRFAVEQQLL